jgi:GDP-L-fucose synthase
MFANKEVLVTGGTGLVGRELVELLVKRGANVTSISLDQNNFPDEWGVHYMREDLRNPDVCEFACDAKDYVFHVAGIKGSPVLTQSHPYTFFTNFIKMNTNMISAMLGSSSMRRGVYTSTVGTYAPSPVFKEEELWDGMPSPNDWYAGWAKRMGEVQIEAFRKQYGDPPRMSVVRPANIYGKFDNFNLKTSTLVPSLVRKVLEAEDSVTVWGDGSAERDIIHARDVARALLFVVEKGITEPLNVGNGKPVSIRTLIKTLIGIHNPELKIEWDATKPKGDACRLADVTKLHSYGFESEVSLEDGLRETLEWYSNRPDWRRYEPFK